MAVKFTKPEVNVREKLVELDKPSGIAGEAMLRAETPQEQFNLISAGRKNLVINGAMQVNQRGTTTGISTAATNYGGPDRHALYVNGNGATFTASQEASGPAGFTKTRLIDCTTANSSALTANQEIKIEYAFEGYDIEGIGYGTNESKHITISFWCKTNQTGEFVVWLYRPDGARHTSVPVTVNSANTWEYKTVTIQPDSSNTVAIDNTAGLFVELILNSGPGYTSGTSPNGNWEPITTANRHVGCTFTIGNSTDDYFEYTGLQVEVGKVATPFEHRSYGEELALCQRYYYKINSAENNANYQRFAMVNIETSTEGEALFIHPVTMRAIPTLETTAVSGFHIFSANAASVVSGMAIDQASPHSVGVALTASGGGLTAGYVGLLDANNNKTAQIAFDAEL